MADGVLHALAAAVETAAVGLAGHEQQVLVDRHVALRRRAEERGLEHGVGGSGNVPHHVAVVIPLDHVIADEADVGIGRVELLRLRRVRDQPHVPRGLAGVRHSRLEADPRVGTRRHGGHRGRCRRRGRGPGGCRWGGLRGRRGTRGLCCLGGLGARRDRDEQDDQQLCSECHRYLGGSEESIFFIRAISVP